MSDQDKVTSIQEARKNPFEPGDVVVLRSGSMPMVIAAGKPNDTTVKCMFVGQVSVDTKELPVIVLETQEDHIKRQRKLHDKNCRTCNPETSGGISAIKEGFIQDGPDGAVIMTLGPNGPEPAPKEISDLIMGIMNGGVDVDAGEPTDGD